MVSSWTQRLLAKILPKYNLPIVNIVDPLSTNSDLLGVEMSLDFNLFTFVQRFTSMVKVITVNIPLGFPNEDKFYKQEVYEDLFECALKIMQNVMNNLSMNRCVNG